VKQEEKIILAGFWRATPKFADDLTPYTQVLLYIEAAY
jgi:hypothetical protein